MRRQAAGAVEVHRVIAARRWSGDERARFVATGLAARAALVLEDLRRRRGLTLAELAVRAGTSKAQVHRLLGGRYGGLTLRSLVRLAHVLGCDVRVDVTPRRRAS